MYSIAYRLSKFGNKVNSVTKLNTAAMGDLIDAAYDIGNATYNNMAVGAKLAGAGRAAADLDAANRDVADRLDALTGELPQFEHLTSEATHHATMLRRRVNIGAFSYITVCGHAVITNRIPFN